MKFLNALILIAIASQSFAQVNSPYSHFGMGNINTQQLSATYGNGFIGTSALSATMLNINNPASYASLGFASYDVALSGNSGSINNGTIKQKYFDMAPAHLALGLPVYTKKDFKWGLSVGILPYSKVSYHLEDQTTQPNGANLSLYKGSGSTYRFYVGNGFKYKNIYGGFHINYLFGTLKYNSAIFFPDSTLSLNTGKTQSYTTGGLYYDFGLIYDLKLNEKNHIAFGGTYQMNSNIHVKNSTLWQRLNEGGIPVDTIRYETGSGKLRLPQYYNISAQWSNGSNFRLGVNYKSTAWSQFHLGDKKDSVADNYLLSIGTQVVQNMKPQAAIKAVYYRGGLYTGTDYLLLKNTQQSVYGVTAGLSLKFLAVGSHIPFFVNLGMDAGSRGIASGGLVKENYFKFLVGVSINDLWFQRPKVD